MRKTNFSLTGDDDGQKIYVSTEDLEVVANPEKEYRKAVMTMSSASSEWNVQFEAVTMIRRIVKHHS